MMVAKGDRIQQSANECECLQKAIEYEGYLRYVLMRMLAQVNGIRGLSPLRTIENVESLDYI